MRVFHSVAEVPGDFGPSVVTIGNFDGVHIGQDDCSLKKARAIVGDERVIGVSCHDSRHLAMEAGEQGADYVAFGAFYPTTSKSPEALAKYGVPKADILEWWQEFMVLPCVAIAAPSLLIELIGPRGDPRCQIERLPGQQWGFSRIKNPIGEQFHAVIQQEPSQSVAPNERSPAPAEGRHKQPINRNQGRQRLRAEHRCP